LALMAAEHVARIGSRIRQRREELGLSQRELAEALPGKSDGNQVSKWELGKHNPSVDTLEAIADVLECDVSYFHVPAPRPGTPDLIGALGTTQLDRIEAKLDELLSRVQPQSLAEATGAVEELPPPVERRPATAAPSPRVSGRKRRAS